MWIRREVQERILGLGKQFPAILVTGARQAGKTALLRHALPAARFISLDLPSAAARAEQSPADLIGETDTPIILDEVQNAPSIFRYLKIAIDNRRHEMGRIWMTGSQKFPLMQSVSESLAGRCAIVDLETLSFHEIHSTLTTSTPARTECVFRGGFPELYRNLQLDSREFFASYVATYLDRDVRLALRVGSLRDFERFVRACATRSGQLLNLTDLARDVGIAGSTARAWISVLEASNQIVLLEPYFNNLGKRLVKSPKLYFKDSGLLCFLLGLETAGAMESSASIGAIWETYVLEQLVKSNAAKGSAARLYFWRDAHGSEVDFVIEHQGRVRLVEVKYAEALDSKEKLRSLVKVHAELGPRAAAEHWVVCRTQHSHRVLDAPRVRLVNGFSFDRWFDAETG